MTDAERLAGDVRRLRANLASAAEMCDRDPSPLRMAVVRRYQADLRRAEAKLARATGEAIDHRATVSGTLRVDEMGGGRG